MVDAVKKAPYWVLMADESTCADNATHEQLGIYVRFVDVEKQRICENFLEMKRIIGHPTADNLFNALMNVMGSDDTTTEERLPKEKLAGLTTDGAAVMISAKRWCVKLKGAVNPKLFSTHCPPHRLVLASKAGQKELPIEVEQTISDTVFVFKDSAVRRDEFYKLQELVQPEAPYVQIVQYHKVRWLSLVDCVDRLVQRLPLLVRYFDEQSRDRSNRAAVREKCATLHSRLGEPTFQLYLFFFQISIGGSRILISPSTLSTVN